jgi:hypothetical protein
VALVLGVLAALIAAAVAFALHDLDGKARQALLGATRELGAQIGRPVTLGAVHVQLGWDTEIVVEDLAIGAAPGATGALAEPLLRVPRARLAVGVAQLARSRGATIDVARFALEAPQITLVRTTEGLSIDDVRARLDAAPAAPPSPRQITVRSLAIAGARLRLLTQNGGPGADLVIAVGGSDLRLDGAVPSRLSVEAATGGAGARATIAIDLAAPEAGAARLAVRGVKARVEGFPVGPLLAFAQAPVPAGVDLSAATLGAEVTLDLAASTLDLRALDLRAGGVVVRGSLRARDLLQEPAVESLDLTGTAEAAAILALVPADRRPPGVAFAGPVSLSLRGSGSRAGAQATLALDLAELRRNDVDASGRVIEGAPAKLGLTTALTFARQGGSLHAEELALQLGELSLRGRVHLGGLGGPQAAPSVEEISLDAAGPIEQLFALAPASRRPRASPSGGRSPPRSRPAVTARISRDTPRSIWGGPWCMRRPSRRRLAWRSARRSRGERGRPAPRSRAAICASGRSSPRCRARSRGPIGRSYPSTSAARRSPACWPCSRGPRSSSEAPPSTDRSRPTASCGARRARPRSRPSCG